MMANKKENYNQNSSDIPLLPEVVFHHQIFIQISFHALHSCVDDKPKNKTKNAMMTITRKRLAFKNSKSSRLLLHTG